MSLIELDNLYLSLKDIKDYLIKIGPERRQSSNTARLKVKEAKELYLRLEYISLDIKTKIEKSEISSDSLLVINKRIDDIQTLYEKILSLCVVSEDLESKIDKMGSQQFDLKTALALLPIMDGQESVTVQLIDAIQLYSSMLNAEGQKQLINFVLKTRVSASAKLRLKSAYASVEELITYMRTYLLQKKSAVALQSQIHCANQGRRSIEKFGSELEQLFVNLTIAQADGDDSKFETLRPLNEKLAIKRFADGLSDSRLSVIIASRQFQSLPEAIRTALDENSMSIKDTPVMSFKPYRGTNYNRFRTKRGINSNRYFCNNQNSNSQHSYTPRSFYNSERALPSRGNTRGRYHRGTPRGRFGKSRPNIHVASVSRVQPEHVQAPECTQSAPDSEFFRAFN